MKHDAVTDPAAIDAAVRADDESYPQAAPAAAPQWRSPEDTVNVPRLVWLREKGRAFLGYYFRQPFQEYRDADGFYVGQQDAEEYWARYEDGDSCEPDAWCELTPPDAASHPTHQGTGDAA